MKSDIHPAYHANAKVRCACGATYEVGSTKESYILDICSACHPFYTGKQKLVDTAGRVDKFMARQKVAAAKQAELKERADKKGSKAVETVEEKIVRKVKAKEEAKEEMKAAKKPAKKAAAKKAPAKKK